jgi:predicted nucleic acid-binding protein
MPTSTACDEGGGARVVVTDANVLINLMHVDRLPLLGGLRGYEFVVPDHVRTEITQPAQVGMLDDAAARGFLRFESVTDLAALTLFAELVACIGRGEAACLALAVAKGWMIASDEKRRFRREVEARLGTDRILRTQDLFVLALEAGLITVQQADADKAVLEERRFKMSFGSFRELVKQSHGRRSDSTSRRRGMT